MQIISLPIPLANYVTGTQGTVTLEVVLSRPATTETSEATVLMLSFWGGSASTFKQLMLGFEESHNPRTYLAISYAGTGNTPAPLDDAAETHSIIPRANQLRVLLQQAEIKELVTSRRLIICAHSMSAKIAYHFLAVLKDEGVQPTGLVLLGPAPVGPLVLPPEMQQQQLQAYETEESATWTIENVLTARPGKLSPGDSAELAKDCARMSPGAKHGWLKHGMAVDCSVVVTEMQKRWPRLAVRVLVGSDDKVETVERVQKGTVMPLQELGFDVEMAVVGGAGHLLPVEAPVAVQEAVSATVLDPR